MNKAVATEPATYIYSILFVIQRNENTTFKTFKISSGYSYNLYTNMAVSSENV